MVGDNWIKLRNDFARANGLGMSPVQQWTNSGGQLGSSPPLEVLQAEQAYKEQFDTLGRQWMESLPPEQQQAAARDFAARTQSFDKSFKVGKGITLAMLAAIGGGAALTASGVIGAGAGATGATAGTTAATTSALEAQLVAGGMSATEAASVAAEVAAATAAEGGVASGVGLASGAGGTAAGAAAGQAALAAAPTAAAPTAAAPTAAAPTATAPGGLSQLATVPNALKLAGAALPLLAGAGGGGSGGTSGGGSGGTSKGMMGGGVLGATGLSGSPQEMTAQSNALAQTRTDWANRPNQTNQYGDQTKWTSEAVLDPATGQMVNKWSNQIVMDPTRQRAIDSEKNINAGMMSNAEGLMGRVGESFAQPMDYSKFQQWGAVPQGDDAARQRMETMLMDRMRPEHQQAQAGLEAQIAAMGLTRGSEQWNREMQRLQDQQSRSKFDAFQTAGNEMQNQYSRDLQSSNYANQLRGSQIGEATAQRMQPLNEMNALRQGNQIQAPQFGDFGASRSPGGVDYNQQYTQQNAETQAGRASTGDALLNIGTTLGSMYYGAGGVEAAGPNQRPGVMNGGYNSQTGQPRQY